MDMVLLVAVKLNHTSSFAKPAPSPQTIAGWDSVAPPVVYVVKLHQGPAMRGAAFSQSSLAGGVGQAVELTWMEYGPIELVKVFIITGRYQVPAGTET